MGNTQAGKRIQRGFESATEPLLHRRPGVPYHANIDYLCPQCSTVMNTDAGEDPNALKKCSKCPRQEKALFKCAQNHPQLCWSCVNDVCPKQSRAAGSGQPAPPVRGAPPAAPAKATVLAKGAPVLPLGKSAPPPPPVPSPPVLSAPPSETKLAYKLFALLKLFIRRLLVVWVLKIVVLVVVLGALFTVGPLSKPVWIPISTSAACERNDDPSPQPVPFQTEDSFQTLEECESACAALGKCQALDWYNATRVCNFYTEPCSNPTAESDDASSYEIAQSCTGSDGSPGTFVNGECDTDHPLPTFKSLAKREVQKSVTSPFLWGFAVAVVLLLFVIERLSTAGCLFLITLFLGASAAVAYKLTGPPDTSSLSSLDVSWLFGPGVVLFVFLLKASETGCKSSRPAKEGQGDVEAPAARRPAGVPVPAPAPKLPTQGLAMGKPVPGPPRTL